MNNLNSVVCVVSGLGMASVHRLSQTWANIPKDTMKEYEDLKSLIDASKNYKNMREYMAGVVPPGLGYVGNLTIKIIK